MSLSYMSFGVMSLGVMLLGIMSFSLMLFDIMSFGIMSVYPPRLDQNPRKHAVVLCALDCRASLSLQGGIKVQSSSFWIKDQSSSGLGICSLVFQRNRSCFEKIANGPSCSF